MKLLDGSLQLPPMPAPLAAPAPEPEPEEPEQPAKRGRTPSPLPDERIPAFSQWLADTNHAVMTIGSYTAAVSSALRQGITPDAAETDLTQLGLSPASLALYARAWRNWLRFTGVTPAQELVTRRRRAASELCNAAKGRHKPTLGDLKRTPWSSLQLLTIDGAQHFTLASDGDQWLWVAKPNVMSALNILIEASVGGPLPTDDTAYERALDAISNLMVHS